MCWFNWLLRRSLKLAFAGPEIAQPIKENLYINEEFDNK
jgi:hypothetical protein